MPSRLAHRPIWWALLSQLRLPLSRTTPACVSWHKASRHSLQSRPFTSWLIRLWMSLGFCWEQMTRIRTIWPPHAELAGSVSGSLLPAHNSDTHCEAQCDASVFCLWVCNQITIATATGLGKLLFRGRSYGCECCTLIWHGLNWDGCSSPTLDFEKWQRKF